METQYDFDIFLVEAAKHIDEQNNDNRQDYLLEAKRLLKKIAVRGHYESQYYLANVYAFGLLNKKDKPDIGKALQLFVQFAKHHHADAAYRSFYKTK